MFKFMPGLGFFLISILVISIGCTGDQGLAGIQGPEGDQGLQGIIGSQGPQGELGATGATGVTGLRGLQGERGESGTRGPAGPPGMPGIAGLPGEGVEPTEQLEVSGAAIDVHTHIMSQALLDGFTGGGVETAGAEELIARLDEGNVDKAVVLALGYMSEIPNDLLASAENDFTAAEVGKYPDRLIGFCGINPTRISAVGEIDRCLASEGMVGIKLNFPGSGLDVTDDQHVASLSAVFDKIQEHDAPVLMHVGDPLGLPLDADGFSNLATIIATHPDVRVTHAHCAGITDDQNIEIWLGGMVALPPVFRPDNFFIEGSSCLKFYKDAPIAKKELIVWRLRKWGLDRVFFGSDYLMIAPAETPQQALETLSMYPFTQEEIDLILDNDASAWLTGN